MTYNLGAQSSFSNHRVHSNILTLLNPHYKSITIGYEYRPLRKYGLEFSFGKIVSHGEFHIEALGPETDVINKSKTRGYSYNIEPKIYFGEVTEDDTIFYPYISLKYYFTNYSYQSTRLKFTNNLSNLAIYDVNQIMHGLIPSIGMNTKLNRILFLDYSIGLGIRWSQVSNNYDGSISDLLTDFRPTSLEDESNTNFKRIRFNLNFKIGTSF